MIMTPAATRQNPWIAYFSMEIALEPGMPTYSGGLGVLAGDTLRSAADLGLPVVGVTLAHWKGYFRQRLDSNGNQLEDEEHWCPEGKADPLDRTTSVNIEGRRVVVRAWRYWIHAAADHQVPIYLLDTCVPENSPWDQTLTDHLYGGDRHYRLCQEVVLGIGGVKLLRRLGHNEITTFHMNEGHAAFISLALLEEQIGDADLELATEADIEEVRKKCVFTTHTPVPSGHDQFSREQMRQVLGRDRASVLEVSHCCPESLLNMTYLALRFSRYVNGVAMRHGDVSQDMFPRYPIHAITNGVHAVTWAAPAFHALYDLHLPGWRHDNVYLRYGIKIGLNEIRQAHVLAKRALLEAIEKHTGARLDPKAFTIGFARRAAVYKRADLVLSDPDRLISMARNLGPIQLVYGGKAHPQDEGGKALIRRIFEILSRYNNEALKIVYVPNYGMEWGGLITSGVDLWLNTPQKPQEASGTSGMKAALNGIPSLSVLDGWWVEGCIEGVTGWAVEDGTGITESESLYSKLAGIILPMFYERPDEYAKIMRSAIAMNGSFFNTQRMVTQYLINAYTSEDLNRKARPYEASARS
jgi:starch phosphorylase